jgi:hypothetical protein
LQRLTIIESIPSIMVLYVNFNTLILEEELHIGPNYPAMKLRGLIYHSNMTAVGHFTSVVVDGEGGMWYHDGISTGRACVNAGRFSDLQDRISLHRRAEETLCAVIYALQ